MKRQYHKQVVDEKLDAIEMKFQLNLCQCHSHIPLKILRARERIIFDDRYIFRWVLILLITLFTSDYLPPSGFSQRSCDKTRPNKINIQQFVIYKQSARTCSRVWYRQQTISVLESNIISVSVIIISCKYLNFCKFAH